MDYTPKIYLTFIILTIIELLNRSVISLPSLTIVYALAIYYWLYLQISYIRKHYNYIKTKYNGIWVIYAFTICNIIMILRGLSHSEDYWDYKNVLLNNGASLFIFLAIFLGKEIILFLKSMKYILKYYLISSVILIYDATIANTGRIMCMALPIMIYFIKKYRWIILIFTLYSLTITWEARGWVLRALFGLFLATISYAIIQWRNHAIIYIKMMYIVLVIFPLLFSYLGYVGKFNIFNMESYINIPEKETANIVDTRTFLYILVQNKLTKDNAVICGEGLNISYWEDFETNTGIKSLDDKGRMATESGLLNIYFWGGLFGAFLFSMLFWLSSFYGIFKSQNNFCKLLGIFIIFRWVISFVDEPSAWVSSNIMLYMTMGICLNQDLRKQNDKYFINIIRKICQ
mgnify:FL=1